MRGTIRKGIMSSEAMCICGVNALRMMIVCVLILTLTGCSAADLISWWPTAQTIDETAEDETDPATQFTTLGLTPDLDYDRPVVESHIEIDQLGYRPDDRKMAVFRGDVLSDVFNVINIDTDETVYTGEIKSKSMPGMDASYYYGDFSAVTDPGVYCIQTDVIGYSYSFTIAEDIYEDLYGDAFRQYYLNRCGLSLTEEYAGESARNACHTDLISLRQDADVQLDVSGGWHIDAGGDRDVYKGCSTIETLLLAYEYNTDSFDDDAHLPESGNGIPDILDEVRFETDWLLKMQEASTGAVYAGVISTDRGLGLDNPCFIAPVSMESTLAFASALGYFSYIYQSFDSSYATSCLQAADRAMKYAARFVDTVDVDDYFKAAAMLYRATGYQYYRNIVAEYCSTHSEYDMSDNCIFTASVIYLSTKQRTDSTVCNVMMNSLRSYAEDMVSQRRDALYLLGDLSVNVDYESLLSEIARLTVVNYITSSNEYENVMEQYLHYFLGCNPYNTCLAGSVGTVNAGDAETSRDVLRQPVTDAYFILLMSGV